MDFSTPKKLWLLAGLGTAIAAGSVLVLGQAGRTPSLARLAAVDACLVAANQTRARQATTTLRGLELAVAKNYGTDRDLAVLHEAQRIQARAQALTDTLRRLHQGWPDSGTPAALARLSVHLKQYSDTLRQYVPEPAPLRDSAPPRTADNWLNEEALTAMPGPVGVAALNRLAVQVRQLAAQALESQARKVGASCGFTKIGALAAPVSNTVKPGAVYEARLLLAESIGGRVHMSVNGQPVPRDPRTGQGLVTLPVPPASPSQPDTVHTRWLGEVHINRGGVLDTVLPVTVPYVIVKHLRP